MRRLQHVTLIKLEPSETLPMKIIDLNIAAMFSTGSSFFILKLGFIPSRLCAFR